MFQLSYDFKQINVTSPNERIIIPQNDQIHVTLKNDQTNIVFTKATQRFKTGRPPCKLVIVNEKVSSFQMLDGKILRSLLKFILEYKETEDYKNLPLSVSSFYDDFILKPLKSYVRREYPTQEDLQNTIRTLKSQLEAKEQVFKILGDKVNGLINEIKNDNIDMLNIKTELEALGI